MRFNAYRTSDFFNPENDYSDFQVWENYLTNHRIGFSGIQVILHKMVDR